MMMMMMTAMTIEVEISGVETIDVATLMVHTDSKAHIDRNPHAKEPVDRPLLVTLVMAVTLAMVAIIARPMEMIHTAHRIEWKTDVQDDRAVKWKCPNGRAELATPDTLRRTVHVVEVKQRNRADVEVGADLNTTWENTGSQIALPREMMARDLIMVDHDLMVIDQKNKVTSDHLNTIGDLKALDLQNEDHIDLVDSTHSMVSPSLVDIDQRVTVTSGHLNITGDLKAIDSQNEDHIVLVDSIHSMVGTSLVDIDQRVTVTSGHLNITGDLKAIDSQNVVLVNGMNIIHHSVELDLGLDHVLDTPDLDHTLDIWPDEVMDLVLWGQWPVDHIMVAPSTDSIPMPTERSQKTKSCRRSLKPMSIVMVRSVEKNLSK
jgi:hypothetical protein